jgi:hypothetical protein
LLPKILGEVFLDGPITGPLEGFSKEGFILSQNSLKVSLGKLFTITDGAVWIFSRLL